VSALERPEVAIAWELRGAWATSRVVVVTLEVPPCAIGRLAGKVKRVAVTGAFAVIDDAESGEWHVPCERILRVAAPHFADR
jgi:hypothetical protein